MGPVNQQKRVILAVADEIETRGMLVDYLEVRDYTVLSAGNADEAIRLLALHPETGLLLTDVVMPGDMGGFNLAQQAARACPEILVVFMTEHPNAEMIADIMMRSRVMLQKPFLLEYVAQIVAAAFAEREAGAVNLLLKL
jgi:DNA-binding NtrC family response regulator